VARNFLTGLRLVNLASDPATGSEGELYYNTVTDKVRLYSNGAWIDVVSASSSSPSDNDILSYNSASTMWVNQNLATAIAEVDGPGSNIDADLLDGQHGSYYTNVGNMDSGTLVIGRGGTGLTSTPTNGQLLIGNGTGYTLATLTAGTNISITNSSGAITIASTAAADAGLDPFFIGCL